MTDFRIAPLLMLIFLSLYQLFQLYLYHVQQEEFKIKSILICIVAILLALGAFRGHHYLSKQYKIGFFSILIFNIVGIFYMTYQFYNHN
jgi:uncharacterized membrane protein